ncbi:MAG: MEKHLA domain-containing protein [Leptolyngbya sp.]|nr:MEKHLA domain-containing protein [Leptolyngbya sp.]
MTKNSAPSPHNDYLADHVDRLRSSFRRFLGQDLIPPDLTGLAAGQALYEADFVVVSHGTEADPIFNYANAMAQGLFEFSWEEFTALPSRLSAELPNREERAQLLSAVTRQGFIRDYRGIRIAKSGRRFYIQNAIVWTVTDDLGTPCGQAATFCQWQYLDE